MARTRVSDTGSRWPGGSRGALCLSFDNLGEAAAIELGAIAPDDPSVGEHPTVTQTLPALLGLLGERGLAATFFVEGLNAELYPRSLQGIAGGGHEVAYHAWRHEQWGELSAAEQTENLARGIAAFDALGLTVAGLRPPGGQLGAGGVEVLRTAGLRYASPAGANAGVEEGVALLPFQWRHVDATCLLPPLGRVREQMIGSPEPIEPGAFLAYLEAEIEQLEGKGGFLSIVLHLPLLDWLGEDRLSTLLDRVSESDGDNMWPATCADAAEHVLRHAEDFRDGSTLDFTSWS